MAACDSRWYVHDSGTLLVTADNCNCPLFYCNDRLDISRPQCKCVLCLLNVHYTSQSCPTHSSLVCVPHPLIISISAPPTHQQYKCPTHSSSVCVPHPLISSKSVPPTHHQYKCSIHSLSVSVPHPLIISISAPPTHHQYKCPTHLACIHHAHLTQVTDLLACCGRVFYWWVSIH